MLKFHFEMGLCDLLYLKPFHLLTLARTIFGEENAFCLHQGFQASIQSPVSTEASVYLRKAVGWKAQRPAAGALTSPLPLSLVGQETRSFCEKMGRRELMCSHTHRSIRHDDRHGEQTLLSRW